MKITLASLKNLLHYGISRNRFTPTNFGKKTPPIFFQGAFEIIIAVTLDKIYEKTLQFCGDELKCLK